MLRRAIRLETFSNLSFNVDRVHVKTMFILQISKNLICNNAGHWIYTTWDAYST